MNDTISPPAAPPAPARPPTDREPSLARSTPDWNQAHQIPARPPIAILGVPFDNLTTTEALDRIAQMVASRQPHYLVTANVDFVVQAQSDIELRRIFADADLVLCDGTPLLWVSRLLGNALVERVAGADIVPLLIERAAERGYGLFFLGATPESCSAAVERLRVRYPTLRIAGHYSPPFNTLLEMDHEEIKRRITEAAPDLLFVAFGCPKAEKWVAMNYRELGVPVAVGVGATIDFLAGHVKRAPIWMRRSGLEWVFRLIQEPRRLFGRYARDLWVFGWRILGQWLLLRRQAGGPAEVPAAAFAQAPDLSHQLVRLRGNLHRYHAESFARVFDAILNEGRPCVLDLTELESVDSTGIALLMRLQQRLQARGAALVLVGVNPSVRKVFKRMQWEHSFACASTQKEAVRLIEVRNRERIAAVETPSYWGTRLTWRGEITASNVAEVWKRTQKILLASDPHQPGVSNGDVAEIVIDLSQVRFIDSSGLSMMVRARRWASCQGIGLAFTGVQPAVASVVRMAHLDDFLQVRLLEKAPALESLSPVPA